MTTNQRYQLLMPVSLVGTIVTICAYMVTAWWEIQDNREEIAKLSQELKTKNQIDIRSKARQDRYITEQMNALRSELSRINGDVSRIEGKIDIMIKSYMEQGWPNSGKIK